MINQKDLSTWNSVDVINWLKRIDMTQYISKFETNKINGYDLIYLTKEDLRSLGIVNIHDKNIILNSMKDALLQQLRLNVNFKEKNITIQLDFDPSFTVEQLTNTLKSIFKPISSIFLVANNNEILMPNLKIIDLILYNPSVYKNFKIMLDSQLVSNNKYIFQDYSNNNSDLLGNKSLNNISQKPEISNKRKYENLYALNIEENYNTDINNNTNLFNKTDLNNNNKDNKEKFSNNFITLEKNDYHKIYLDKKDKYNQNISNKNNEMKYNSENPLINKYKSYGEYIKNNNNNFNNDIENKNINNYEKINNKREIKNKANLGSMGINTNREYINNKIYDYNRDITPNQNEIRKQKSLSTNRKKYSIQNGELNYEVEEDKMLNKINNNINYSSLQKEDDENQKFSSEKRNFRTSEFNFREDNYENNNIDNNNITNNMNHNINNNFINKSNYNYTQNNGLINRNRNNYDFNSIIVNKDNLNERMNNTTSGFTEYRQYNNTKELHLQYNEQK